MHPKNTEESTGVAWILPGQTLPERPAVLFLPAESVRERPAVLNQIFRSIREHPGASGGALFNNP